jgi:hypothetical protein
VGSEVTGYCTKYPVGDVEKANAESIQQAPFMHPIEEKEDTVPAQLTLSHQTRLGVTCLALPVGLEALQVAVLRPCDQVG